MKFWETIKAVGVAVVVVAVTNFGDRPRQVGFLTQRRRDGLGGASR